MSVKSVAGSRESPLTGHFFAQTKDLFAGLAGSVMSVAYGLSFAALIFSASLHTWLAYGIAATFVTTAISAAFVAARSSLPFAVAAPDGATAAVTATLAATVAQHLIDMGPPDDLLAPVMVVVALATLLTGILLFTLGLARAGGAIGFIPYPVIGGFLSATGWLMVSGAVRVITDHGLSFSTAGELFTPVTLGQLAAAGAVALALYLGVRRGGNPFLLPGIMLVAAILAHLAFALTGTSLGEALALGWTFKAPTTIGLAPTWDFGDLRDFPWRILPGVSGDIFAVMFVTAITMLLNTTGIELATRREANLGRGPRHCEIDHSLRLLRLTFTLE
jgi:sulfate permease, SulP family